MSARHTPAPAPERADVTGPLGWAGSVAAGPDFEARRAAVLAAHRAAVLRRRRPDARTGALRVALALALIDRLRGGA